MLHELLTIAEVATGASAAAAATASAPAETAAPPVFTVAPFVVLLLAIAVLPLIHRTEHWWEQNRNKFMVSISCGLIAALMLWTTMSGSAGWHAIVHAAEEFVPFIVLLGSLYIISGGILISGSLKGTPQVNTAVMALGAVLANVLGTTGASMLLIRPILRSNAHRKHRAHTVVFFIFLVSNMGGMLLPIGDPPLFLGYLRGVPFEWTLQLWDAWAVCNFATLVIYLALDTMMLRKERAGMNAAPGANASGGANLTSSDAGPTPLEEANLRISGGMNFVWLIGVVWATAVLVPGKTLGMIGWEVTTGAREGVMIFCAIASMVTTPRPLRRENKFTFGPIIEVAALFSGLFIAMQPALQILSVHGDKLGATQPAQFFWLTGVLSSFLDNAPTYLVFANVGVVVTPQDAANTVHYDGALIREDLLRAISCGAVMMGAMTYIGNGPNLMVSAIARNAGVPMPSFFGYLGWSCAVLLPVFGLITLIFFV